MLLPQDGQFSGDAGENAGVFTREGKLESMRLRVLALVGLVVLVIVGALAASFFFLSPYSVAQNQVK